MGASPQRSTSDLSASLREIAEILATGLMRLRARKSSAISADSEESSLHISPAKSGHPDPVTRRNRDDC